jgi:hypothetical protein
MGDRSNVFIQTHKDGEVWAGIGIYAHWDGTTLHEVALDMLPKAMARKGDPAYFARILVHNVLDELADADSATGHGLWIDWPCDNQYPVLVVNAMTGEHWYSTDQAFMLDRKED